LATHRLPYRNRQGRARTIEHVTASAQNRRLGKNTPNKQKMNTKETKKSKACIVIYRYQ
jgi:hypothetical protein